MCSQCKILL